MIYPDLITHDIFNYGYHIIDDFLELHDYLALRATALEMHDKGLFKSAKIGLKIKAEENSLIRSDEIFWIDDYGPKPAEKAYLDHTHRVAQILNQSLFLGLFEFETHFAVYEKGSFYKKHVDQFAQTKDRKISCVYYLNNEWHEEFGGALKLYSPEQKLLKTILPQGNRFICFKSELPHEVCTTQATRYSIAGWMKTRALSPA